MLQYSIKQNINDKGETGMEEKKQTIKETEKETPKRGEDEKSTDELEQFIEEQGIQLRY